MLTLTCEYFRILLGYEARLIRNEKDDRVLPIYKFEEVHIPNVRTMN
jgi:hypothetical protein